MSLRDAFQGGWLTVPSGITESIALREYLKQIQLRIVEAFKRLTIDNLEATLAETSLYPVAWGGFDGTTVGTNTVIIGKGLSTVQRTGVGAYTVVLLNEQENNTYGVFCSVNTSDRSVAVTGKTTSSFTLQAFKTSDGTASDFSGISVIVYPNRG